MAIVIRPAAAVKQEEELLRKAREKVARTSTEEDFNLVAGKFVQSVLKLRAAMKATGATDFNNYDYFFGGFEQCDVMLSDPKYWQSEEAQRCYQLLLGADAWLKHEAEKLGEAFVSPNHFYIAWQRVAGIDLKAAQAQLEQQQQ